MTDNKIKEKMENGKMVYTDLKQTVGLMTSTDYKERLVGEFVQAVIRNKKLERFIEAVNSGAIQPQEHCDMETLDLQDLAMKNYILVLGIRLVEEGIEPPEVEG